MNIFPIVRNENSKQKVNICNGNISTGGEKVHIAFALLWSICCHVEIRHCPLSPSQQRSIAYCREENHS